MRSSLDEGVSFRMNRGCVSDRALSEEILKSVD